MPEPEVVISEEPETEPEPVVDEAAAPETAAIEPEVDEQTEPEPVVNEPAFAEPTVTEPEIPEVIVAEEETAAEIEEPEEEIPETEQEEPIKEPAEEVPAEPVETAEDIAVKEPAPIRQTPIYQSDFVHPWEQEKEELKVPDFSEPEHVDVAPVNVEETPAPQVENEVKAEAHEASEDKPQFYTFSQKNEAFQELLRKERERLESMGSGYTPKNEEVKAPSVAASVAGIHSPGLAYEESGHFVEEVVQPIETTVADLSGDAKHEKPQFRYDFSQDIDWLSEIKSQTSIESLNKTKKRYSEIFAKPITEEKNEEEVKYEPKTLEEKKLAAEEINRIFDEDENTKPKKHIVGNTIIILLILLILFEGSVLAAKLLAPDSSYAHLTDGIIEKVMDLVSGNKGSDSAEPAPAPSEEGEDQDVESYYPSMVAKLADNATTIGEITYNEDLTYSSLTDTAFDGVLDLDVLEDSDWIENDEGGMVTYAEAIYDSIIAYYDSWLSGNTDENLVGINSLELGEIRHDDEGYYALSRVTYADKDGGSYDVLQTCYLTVNGNSMFIEKISEEESINE